MGVLDGVTTNPSLMAKEGIKGKENQYKHYIEICNIVNGDVSAEVIATDYEGMIREGQELADLNEHIVVKLPCTEAGIKAVKYFSGKGIKTNCTLVFSLGQALLAAKAGATYVSPFVGRLDDISEEGIGLLKTSSRCTTTMFRDHGSRSIHTSYPPYHRLPQGRRRCSDLSSSGHQGPAQASPYRLRSGQIPRGLPQSKRLISNHNFKPCLTNLHFSFAQRHLHLHSCPARPSRSLNQKSLLPPH